MALITFVLVIHTLIAAALVAVILLQRSEGGALGIGQSTGGLVSARGAADLLTRSTSVLAAVFIGTSLLLAILYGQQNKTRKIDATTVVPVSSAPAPATPAAPVPMPGSTPSTGVPLFPSAPSSGAPAPAAPPATN